MKDLYVVTGGAGFIGSHLVEHLLGAGERVRVVDDFSSGTRSNLENARRAAGGSGELEVRDGSLADADFADDAIRGASYVLHQAAIPSVPRSVAEPLRTHAANATGTLNALQAAKTHGVKRFVYASSSSAYGDTPTLPKVETMPTSPLSPYAIQKLAGEQYARVYHALYGLPTVCLRYFNVFGPRQDPASEYAAVVPKFITAIHRGEQPVIFGDGGQTRDFCFIENTVHANLLSCKAGDEALGKAYNIACGERISLVELVGLINGILGTSIEPLFAEPRPGDVRHSLADIGAARKLLGYEVKVSLEEGLGRTAAWFTGRS
jgi:UDP-glucose 4-epimerase